MLIATSTTLETNEYEEFEMTDNHDNIDFLYALNHAWGYAADEKSHDIILKLLIDGFKALPDKDSARASHLQSMLPNLGYEDDYKNDEAHEAEYFALIKKAADGGIPEAQYIQACSLYESGKYREAHDLYRLSAEQGYPPAQHSFGLDIFMGLETDDGFKITKNESLGLHYLTLAAHRLHTLSIEFLLEHYNSSAADDSAQKIELYTKMLAWSESEHFQF